MRLMIAMSSSLRCAAVVVALAMLGACSESATQIVPPEQIAAAVRKLP
jgi:hypothetical protein